MMTSFQVACDYISPDTSQVATSFTAVFDNTIVFPKQLCPACDPNVYSCHYPIYQTYNATVQGPASGSAVLKFVVSQDAVDNLSYPLLLDIVYLKGQTYEGPTYNPPIV